uniref:FERM domain-containing protein 4B n=1 Tax=Sphaerodactylus townsendi TaxID=933632 RepID=A0ACB8EH65_9SAUR
MSYDTIVVGGRKYSVCEQNSQILGSDPPLTEKNVIVVFAMTEGRHCQVQLLDDRKLELLVQPKLLSRELLDLVASHFSLKEKEYFGITFIDDTGQTIWLQLDHRVLEHDLPKKPGPVPLYFAVRFYIESISFLKDKTTVELFFLNAKACVHKDA